MQIHRVTISTHSGSEYVFEVHNTSGLRQEWGVDSNTPATQWFFLESSSSAAADIPMGQPVYFGQHFPFAGGSMRFKFANERGGWDSITSTTVMKIVVDGEVESYYSEEEYALNRRMERIIVGAFGKAFG